MHSDRRKFNLPESCIQSHATRSLQDTFHSNTSNPKYDGFTCERKTLARAIRTIKTKFKTSKTLIETKYHRYNRIENPLSRFQLFCRCNNRKSVRSFHEKLLINRNPVTTLNVLKLRGARPGCTTAQKSLRMCFKRK